MLILTSLCKATWSSLCLLLAGRTRRSFIQPAFLESACKAPYPDTCYCFVCKGRVNQWADGNIQCLKRRGATRAPAVSDLINPPKGCLTRGAYRCRLEWRGISSHLAVMKQWRVVLETAASFSGWTNGEFLKGKFLALLGPLTHPLLGGTAFSMTLPSSPPQKDPWFPERRR